MHKYVEKCGGKQTVDILSYSDAFSSLSLSLSLCAQTEKE